LEKSSNGVHKYAWRKNIAKTQEAHRGSANRGVEASFSKTTGNKTLEFGGVSPSNDLTRYKKESFSFYLI
jgi:hypothetical protein